MGEPVLTDSFTVDELTFSLSIRARCSLAVEYLCLRHPQYSTLETSWLEYPYNLAYLVILSGPAFGEPVVQFAQRACAAVRYLEYHLSLLWQLRNDVVGRLQEERQPGDDPGNDEDGPRGANLGPGLRGGGASVPNDGGGSEPATEGGQGLSR